MTVARAVTFASLALLFAVPAAAEDEDTQAVAPVDATLAPNAMTATVSRYPLPTTTTRYVFVPAGGDLLAYTPLQDRSTVTNNRVAVAPRDEAVPYTVYWPPDVRYSDAQMVYNAARYAYSGVGYSFIYGGWGYGSFLAVPGY